MQHLPRKQLMSEFMQSYRITGQLFFKLLQESTQGKKVCTMAHLPILKALLQDGPMSQSAIARKLYHSDAAISRQVGMLIEDGLVKSALDGQNRRQIIIELTERGEEILNESEKTITDFLTDLLSPLPDERLQQLIDHNSQLQTIITSKLEKEPRV